MPEEKSDNTRVESKQIIVLPIKQNIPQRIPNNDMLWDTREAERYDNMQNFYNNNFWGYGVFGRQTNHDSRISQGQKAIQSDFNYSKNNAQNFIENIAVSGIGEGIGQIIKWATTPVVIGNGAEAVTSSAPLSAYVTKVSTIPRSEMHLRNTIPGSLKAEFVKSNNGLNVYVQPKVKILSEKQLERVSKQLEKYMESKGWNKITHPNLQGLGFTNGRYVISDLNHGNVGRDLLGRIRLVDFAVETMPEFKLAMQKQGGKFN